MTTIYRIKLHKNLEAENFTKFMVEKIFPAIPKVLDNNPASANIAAGGNDLYQMHNNGPVT
jgi:hypothetical protein